MKNSHRVTLSLYFVVVLPLVVVCFVVLRELPDAILQTVTFDDAVTHWIDHTLRLPTHLDPQDAPNSWQRTLAGGSYRWLVDITTIPLVAWAMRFILGAIEEVRYTHHTTTLHVVEIVARWLGLAATLLLAMPIVALLLYRVLRVLTLWEPLAILAALGFFSFLSFWAWEFPNRRLKHVEKVYHFERLKQNG